MSTNEWYTPARYIDAVWAVLGRIDLDPASCEFANQVVRADRFYTKEDNGLMHPWYGKIYLNPPYGKTERGASSLEAFTCYLLEQYRLHRVTEAILLIPANTATSWFDLLWEFPICFPKRRIRFIQENGLPSDGISFGTCFVYFGSNIEKFTEIFSQFGRIVRAIDMPKPQPITPELWSLEEVTQ